MAITTIAEIPFEQREPLALLAIGPDRLDVDADYAGFGWAVVDAVVLTAPDRPPVTLDHAVILALHSADVQPDPADIELLFELPAQSVQVPASRFLPHALTLIPPGLPVVLALCNPGRVSLPPLSADVHYALGDVTSWLDPDAGGPGTLRLSARRWRRCGDLP